MPDTATSTIAVHIVDSAKSRVASAVLKAQAAGAEPIAVQVSDGHYLLRGVPHGSLMLEASASGFEQQRLAILVRDPTHLVVLGLPRPGERSYTQGDSRLSFAPDPDAFLLLLRGHDVARRAAGVIAQVGIKTRATPERIVRDPSSGQYTWNLVNSIADEAAVVVEASVLAVEDAAKAFQDARIDVVITRLIGHGDRVPHGLGNEAVARFAPAADRSRIDRLAASHGFSVVRELHHAGNAFLLNRPGIPDYGVLDAIDALRAESGVVCVEANLVTVLQLDQYTPDDLLWPSIPHLQLVRCDAAWDRLGNESLSLRGGSPDVTIAVIDPGGVAPDHPELTASLTDKTAKMVANANFTVYPPVIQTVADLGDDHGTQCAGSAAAAFDDQRGIAGAAPNCHLIGARIHATPTAVEMADAFLWAAGFGNSGAGLPLPNPPADVISASFGNDGVTLSDTIRDCFEFLTTSGRGGRGCLICFSIGNTGYLNFTDPAGVRFRAWATSAKTIAVGASINVNPTNPVATSYYPVPGGPSTDIPTQVDRRTFYSPFGSAMLEKPDFVAPSHTAYDKNGVMFDPIMSCVRVGTGDINGCAGPQCNDYRASFGGTSHACPVVAGVAALVISARPDLTWMQVRDVLRQTATRVDIGTTNPTGKWKDLDGDGVAEFSRWYGYGRIDADTAVAVALGL